MVFFGRNALTIYGAMPLSVCVDYLYCIELALIFIDVFLLCGNLALTLVDIFRITAERAECIA